MWRAELGAMLIVKVNPLLGQTLFLSLSGGSRLPTDSLLGEYFRADYAGLQFLSFPCG